MKKVWFTAPMEKAWFYERWFFDVVIVMVKDKKDAIWKIQCQSNLVLCITRSGQG